MPTHPRRRIYNLFEGRRPHGWALVLRIALFALILLNVLAVVLETVESLYSRYSSWFQWFEVVSVAIFTAEYALRLYSCVEEPHDRFRDPATGRLRFALTPFAIVDFLAIVPMFLMPFGVDAGDLRIVRVLRVFKLGRYSPAMGMLGRVLYAERKNLAGALITLLVLLVLSSSTVYFLEREAQPKGFGSIPESMWWAMSALTTVGYGDVTPVTPLGRVVGGFVTILGIVMLALPTGILASGFIEETKRRNFVVTWSLVANVPLFSGLIAARIAEIVELLKPHVADPGEIIVRKGDDAHSMFIIESGEAQVDFGAGREPVLLRGGAIFGEMALIEKATRSATIRAASELRLLELSASDFHALMESHAELRDIVHRIAVERKSSSHAHGARREAGHTVLSG